VHIHISHCFSAPAHICECCNMLVSWPQRSVICFLFHPWLNSCSPHFCPLPFIPDISDIRLPPLIYFCVTPTHFPVPSTWPRHTAQSHHHSPLAHYLNSPSCPPLYNTSFPTNSIFFLHHPEDSQQAPPNIDTYIQIYTAWYPTRLKFSRLPLWEHQITNFTFSEPCIVIHVLERPKRHTFFLNNLSQLNYPRHFSNK
jgi:hypothetical protein